MWELEIRRIRVYQAFDQDDVIAQVWFYFDTIPNSYHWDYTRPYRNSMKIYRPAG